jgi:uncharacterized protein (DUF169 family)
VCVSAARPELPIRLLVNAVVREKPKSVVYGPLRDMTIEPSVILLRLNGKQQMLLHDAWPGLRFEGKPQCATSFQSPKRGARSP